MKIKLQNQLFYSLFVSSLFISMYIGENSSGGSQIDNLITQTYIDDFDNSFFYGIKSFLISGQIHSPIFYYIISLSKKILNYETLKIMYVLISSILPYIFYKSLRVKFRKVDQKYIFFLSLIIFLSPYFRSSSSWITNDNLSLVFFGLSIFYFLKAKQIKKSNNIDFYLCFIFLSLSAYIRQYYGLFFIVYLIEVLRTKNKLLILKCLILNAILSIPFFIYLSFYFKYQGEILQSPNSTDNSLLENIPFVLSIIFFYISMFVASMKLNFSAIKKEIHKEFKNILLTILTFIIFLTFLNTQDYLFGGGTIYKIGSFLNIGIPTTYIFAVISFIVIFLSIEKSINNLLIILILCFISFELVYQKYYDPLILIIFFTLIDSKKVDFIIKGKLINLKKIFFIKLSFLIFCNLYYI